MVSANGGSVRRASVPHRPVLSKRHTCLVHHPEGFEAECGNLPHSESRRRNRLARTRLVNTGHPPLALVW